MVAPDGELVPSAVATTGTSPLVNPDGTTTLIWKSPGPTRPANNTVALVPPKVTVGSVNSGAAPEGTWPAVAGGFVTPKPVPKSEIISPAEAGLAVVMGAPLAWFASMCPAVSARKKAGATGCTLTVSVVVRPLLLTTSGMFPKVARSGGVSIVICTGLMD